MSVNDPNNLKFEEVSVVKQLTPVYQDQYVRHYKIAWKSLDCVYKELCDSRLTADEVEQFEQECRRAIRIISPFVSRVNRYVSERFDKPIPKHYGLLCDSYEYSLEDYVLLKRGEENATPLSSKEIIDIAYDVVRGIWQLHSLGSFHGNISPRSIFFSDRIWKVGETQITALTRCRHTTKASANNYTYSNPEAINPGCRGAIGLESDLYSFATVLYFMFTAKNIQTDNPKVGNLSKMIKILFGNGPGIEDIVELNGLKQEAFKRVESGDDDEKAAGEYDSAILGIMEGCWKVNRRERMTVGDVHNCLRDVREKDPKVFVDQGKPGNDRPTVDPKVLPWHYLFQVYENSARDFWEEYKTIKHCVIDFEGGHNAVPPSEEVGRMRTEILKCVKQVGLHKHINRPPTKAYAFFSKLRSFQFLAQARDLHHRVTQCPKEFGRTWENRTFQFPRKDEAVFDRKDRKRKNTNKGNFEIHEQTDPELELRKDVYSYYEQLKNEQQQVILPIEKCDKATVLCTVRGCRSRSAAFRMAEGGITNRAKIDIGYFGNMRYVATEGKYAGIYAGESTQYYLICYVVVGNVFPVIEDPFGPNSLKGLTNVPGYDAHFVRVVRQGPPGSTIYVPATQDNVESGYNELCVANDSQIFPAYLLQYGDDAYKSGYVPTDHTANMNNQRRFVEFLDTCFVALQDLHKSNGDSKAFEYILQFVECYEDNVNEGHRTFYKPLFCRLVRDFVSKLVNDVNGRFNDGRFYLMARLIGVLCMSDKHVEEFKSYKREGMHPSFMHLVCSGLDKMLLDLEASPGKIFYAKRFDRVIKIIQMLNVVERDDLERLVKNLMSVVGWVVKDNSDYTLPETIELTKMVFLIIERLFETYRSDIAGYFDGDNEYVKTVTELLQHGLCTCPTKKCEIQARLVLSIIRMMCTSKYDHVEALRVKFVENGVADILLEWLRKSLEMDEFSKPFQNDILLCMKDLVCDSTRETVYKLLYKDQVTTRLTKVKGSEEEEVKVINGLSLLL